MDKLEFESVTIAGHDIVVDGEARFDLALQEKKVHVWIAPVQNVTSERNVTHLVFHDAFQFDLWLTNWPRVDFGDLFEALEYTSVVEDFIVTEHAGNRAITPKSGPFAGGGVFTRNNPMKVVLATASFILEFIHVGEVTYEELTTTWPVHI